MPAPISPHPSTPTVLISMCLLFFLCAWAGLSGPPGGPERPALRRSNRVRDVVARFLRAERTVDIAGRVAGDDGVVHGRFDRGGFSFQSEILEHQRGGQDRADRVRDVLARQRRRRSVHRFEHRRHARVQIARRRHAEPALQRRAQIRDDVAEQIVGDDDLELRGVLHHQQREPVDVEMARLDVGIPRRDFLEHALPERVTVGHRVALVGHAHLPPPVGMRKLKRVRDDAVHALVGVHLLLYGDFVFGAGLEPAANADVQTFGALAEHDEVHVAALAALQRAESIVEELDRPVVDVEVELEARPEEDIAGVAIVGHAWIAERADEHRIELPQQRVAVGRNRDAGLQIMIGAPGQHLELDRSSEHVSRAAQHLDGFSRDIDADAIPRDDRDLQIILSIATAMPMPPLTQSVASPRVARRRSSSCSSVTTIRAPVHPIGWPSAIAPPLTFSRSEEIGTSRTTASTCAAKASFNSTRSKSSIFRPVRAVSFWMAGTGPMPMIRGSTPALAQPTILARGASRRARAASADAITTAAPPSVIPDDEPAVMMPGRPSTSPNTGGSLRRLSIVVSPRGCSSRSTIVDWLLIVIVTGAISRAKKPASIAAFALR